MNNNNSLLQDLEEMLVDSYSKECQEYRELCLKGSDYSVELEKCMNTLLLSINNFWDRILKLEHENKIEYYKNIKRLLDNSSWFYIHKISKDLNFGCYLIYY